MIRIINQYCVRIIKYSFCFFKRNAMFLLVNLVFIFIPFELHLIHNYIIITPHFIVNT